jgi:cytosine/adenosine deaminase-related metal-dependent hydrolase
VIVIDQRSPFASPVFDPLRSLVYYSHTADLRHSLVNGRPVVEDGKVRGVDMSDLAARVDAACRRLWDLAADQDAFPGQVRPASRTHS